MSQYYRNNPDEPIRHDWSTPDKAPSVPTVCKGCGNEIDPEVCWCGSVKEQHGLGLEEHGFVPMGCDCGRAKH